MFEAVDKGDVLVASPRLDVFLPRVCLHFQFGPEGRLNSPQVPDGNMRDLAESRFISPERLEASVRRLDQLKDLVTQPTMALCCPEDDVVLAPQLRA